MSLTSWQPIGDFRLTGWQYVNLDDESAKKLADKCPVNVLPEPENPHDNKALVVVGMANKDDKTLEGRKLGYLPADAARVLSFFIAEGYGVCGRAYVAIPPGKTQETYLIRVYARRPEEKIPV
jgi:hypothetical protein